ncbi:MAG: GLUG motif-containing protein, partial [Rhizomicrobium sp.]
IRFVLDCDDPRRGRTRLRRRGGLEYRHNRSSFAGGTVGLGEGCQYAGGLVGTNYGTIGNSYATGDVIAGLYETAGGGLIGWDGNGEDDSRANDSYSTGTVKGEYLGGFVGYADSGRFKNCDWDTKTSGIASGSGFGNGSGITGLTSHQLRSGLPKGFDSAIWAQDNKINNGFPYLIANPPRK